MFLFVKRRIIRGTKKGKLLGYPTANVRLYNYDKIRHGVWATIVKMNDKVYKSISHVGSPISFGNKRKKIETFIFNYDKNLYNKIIEIKFVKWLRKTKRFSNKEALIEQIEKDCLQAKEIISKYKSKVDVHEIDHLYSFGNQNHKAGNEANRVKEYLFIGS